MLQNQVFCPRKVLNLSKHFSAFITLYNAQQTVTLQSMDYEEVARLMEEHGIDKDTAEKAQELIEEQDLDEDEAIELAEEM